MKKLLSLSLALSVVSFSGMVAMPAPAEGRLSRLGSWAKGKAKSGWGKTKGAAQTFHNYTGGNSYIQAPFKSRGPNVAAPSGESYGFQGTIADTPEKVNVKENRYKDKAASDAAKGAFTKNIENQYPNVEGDSRSRKGYFSEGKSRGWNVPGLKDTKTGDVGRYAVTAAVGVGLAALTYKAIKALQPHKRWNQAIYKLMGKTVSPSSRSVVNAANIIVQIQNTNDDVAARDAAIETVRLDFTDTFGQHNLPSLDQAVANASAQ